MLLKELERSANRAAADARRHNRRVEGVRIRALEREMVRAERAAERARIEQERHLSQLRVVNERERAKQLRVDAKQAQLREWQLEVEAYSSKDEASLRIANDGPEVEERDALFAELLRPIPWLAPEFEAPALPDALRQGIQQRHDEALAKRVSGFHSTSTSSTLGLVQLGVGVAGAAAGMAAALPASPDGTAWSAFGAIACWALLEAVERHRYARRRAVFVAEEEEASQARADREVETESAAMVAEARRAFEARIALEASEHEGEQSRRIGHATSLLRGDSTAIQAELPDLFPLELSPEVPCRWVLVAPKTLQLDLAIELAEALQPQNAKLLASGKPSFRTKTQKQLRGEAQRYAAGVAMRHASEAMLFLPSIAQVHVNVALRHVAPSTGTESAVAVLKVSYDFAALGPLQMEAIDPVEALGAFKHEWSQGPLDAEVKRMVGK